MSSILKLQYKRVSSYAKNIAYISNSSYITTSYGSWSGSTATIYKFIVAGTPTTGQPMIINIYKDNVFQSNLNLAYTTSDAFNWFGSVSNIIDGIAIDLTLQLGISLNTTEEFTLSLNPTISTTTIQKDKMQFGAGVKACKVIFRDGTGDHIVYHEDVVSPELVPLGTSTTTAEWEIGNLDPNPINIYAKIGSSTYSEAYSLIASNVTAEFAYERTGLDDNTSYTLYAYAVPSSSLDKRNSEVVTDVQQTASAATYAWVYLGLQSSPANVTYIYVGDVTAYNPGPAALASQLTSLYPPASNIGANAMYETASASFEVFQVQLV